MQKAEMVTRVKNIIQKPSMKPTLNASIFRTQARGEKNATTTKAKYSCLMFLIPDRAWVVDLRLPIMKAS